MTPCGIPRNTQRQKKKNRGYRKNWGIQLNRYGVSIWDEGKRSVMVLLTLDFTPMNQTCKNGYNAKCFHVYFITKIFKRFTPSKKLIPVYILKTKNGLKNNYDKKGQTYQLYYLKMTQITRENKLANNCYKSILSIIISQYHSVSPHLKTCGRFPSKKTEPITLKAELTAAN